MGVVGSLPSPPSSTVLNNTSNVQNEQVLPLSDEHSNDMMSVSYDIISDIKLNTNINNNIIIKKNIDDTKSRCRSRSKTKRYTTVSYGPISVRVSHSVAPTLKTGRRSKFTPLEGEEAIKRELRRQKNREIARKLKEKRTNIERQLENEINELESNEKNLLTQINTLESYKQLLEEQIQRIIFFEKKNMSESALSTLSKLERIRRQTKRNTSIHCEHKQMKLEPHSPSSQ